MHAVYWTTLVGTGKVHKSEAKRLWRVDWKIPEHCVSSVMNCPVRTAAKLHCVPHTVYEF